MLKRLQQSSNAIIILSVAILMFACAVIYVSSGRYVLIMPNGRVLWLHKSEGHRPEEALRVCSVIEATYNTFNTFTSDDYFKRIARLKYYMLPEIYRHRTSLVADFIKEMRSMGSVLLSEIILDSVAYVKPYYEVYIAGFLKIYPGLTGLQEMPYARVFRLLPVRRTKLNPWGLVVVADSSIVFTRR